MKKTAKCPKCDGADIRVVTFGQFRKGMTFIGLGFYKWAKVDCHVCAGCGYIENYVSPDELQKIREYSD